MEKDYFDDPVLAAYLHIERLKSKEEIDRYLKAMKDARIRGVWLFVAHAEKWKLDYFLNQASKMNLSVVPVFQPRITIREHPEVRVVNADGSFSETADWANIGCFNHPFLMGETKKIVGEFLIDYKDHPSLYKIGGRPLVSFVHEAYYRNDLPERGGGPIRPCCYCEHCVDNFRAKMKEKHHGIESFNHKHGTSFSSWKKMKPPIEPSNASFWKEWFDYHAEIIPSFLKKLIDYANSITRVTSTHELNDFYPCTYQCVYSGNDFWRMARVLDVGHEDMYPLEFDHRYVIYVFEYPKDMLRTAMGFDKLYTGNGQSFNSWLGYRLPAESMSEQIYSTLAHGALGLVWWVDWKNLDLWARSTQPNEEYGRLVAELRDYRLSRAEIALVYPWTTMELKSDDTYSMDNVLFYMALVRSGFPVDIVSEDQVTDGILTDRGYKAACTIGCPLLPTEVTSKIRDFVMRGGTLITDYEGERVGEFSSAFPNLVERPSVEHTIYTLETGISLLEELNGKIIPVADKCEKLSLPKDAKVIAKFENEDPAIIIVKEGKGTVTKVGSLLGWDYSNYPGHYDLAAMFPFHIRRNETVRELISKMLKRSGIEPPAESSNPDVEVAVWKGESKSMILVINHLNQPSETTVSVNLDSEGKHKITEFFTDSLVESKSAGEKLEFKVALPNFRGRAYVLGDV